MPDPTRRPAPPPPDAVRSAPPPAAGEYVLGANDVELARLTLQQEVWGEVTERFLDHVGVPVGGRVLDLGCGPGLVLPSLRRRVGAAGTVDALDASPTWIAHVERRAAADGWSNVRPRCARLEDAALPPATYDVVFARWVVEFVPSPGTVIAGLAAALRPGGVLALMDYNHEGISVFPESEGFRAVVRAMRAMWRRHGGDAFLAGRFPGLFRAAGLAPLPALATVLTGGPDTGVFRWADAFFPAHSANMVREGVLSADERARFLAEWAARKADPDAVFFSPIVVGAAARKPLDAGAPR
jgi:SAM-dependent methyltransferase